MGGFFRSRGFIILLVVMVVLAILVAVTYDRFQVTFIEDAVNSIAAPIQSFSVKASNSIIDFFERVFSSTDLDKENEQLKVQLAQYEIIESELNTLREENERLKGLLNYTDVTENYTYITATVIGKSQGIWFSEFTLNAGRNDGVVENQAVVNARGLVGRVSSVSANTCKVVSIIDSTSDVSVMVERTRDYGFARGILNTDDDEKLELYYLPSGYDLVPGDNILTSGIGGIFPKGIAVGTVTEVSRANEDTEDRNAIIEPAVDFLRLEEVMIVNMEEQEEE
ncbi:MAG: rod shape-determining protein MreC [Clostridia bacterium]|nr:rod shape-determining protein MreC [Clostridia bacterium]MBQ4610628.1 rod shape-determining protein MreC [Clostridia bacterium]